MRSRTAGAFLAVVGLVTIVAVLVFRPAGADQVEGLIVDVQGDLATVESFTLRTGSGELITFVPEEGLGFDDGPLSHVRDHLRSLEPVTVTFEDRRGVHFATSVADG